MAPYNLVTLLSFFVLIYQGCKVASAFNPKERLIAEGFFVYDAQAKQMYLSEEHGNDHLATERLLTDARLNINGVKAYYKTLMRYGLNIEIRIAGIQILNKNIVPADKIGPNNVVNNHLLLNEFRAFLKTRNALKQPKEYDFAILMTGLTLNNANGIAFVSSMCDGTYACGIVHLRGTWQDSSTTAHELGHIFGAPHVPTKSLTVMKPNMFQTRDVRKYAFSGLSADHIITNLNISYSKRSCLLRTSPSSEVADFTPDKYVGNAQDPYYICQRSLGFGSVPCVNTKWYEGNESRGNACGLMACRSWMKSSKFKLGECYYFTPTEGMQCDAGKSCRKGLCVDDPRPQLTVYKALNYRTLKCSLNIVPIWAIIKCVSQNNSDFFYWITKDNDRAREILTASCSAYGCTSYSRVVLATMKVQMFFEMISELTVIRREYFDELETKVWICRISAICGNKEKRVYFPK